MAARIPLGGGSSSYIHNYQLQGRYMPAHHNVMVRSAPHESCVRLGTMCTSVRESETKVLLLHRPHTARQQGGTVSAPLTVASLPESSRAG